MAKMQQITLLSVAWYLALVGAVVKFDDVRTRSLDFKHHTKVASGNDTDELQDPAFAELDATIFSDQMDEAAKIQVLAALQQKFSSPCDDYSVDDLGECHFTPDDVVLAIGETYFQDHLNCMRYTKCSYATHDCHYQTCPKNTLWDPRSNKCSSQYACKTYNQYSLTQAHNEFCAASEVGCTISPGQDQCTIVNTNEIYGIEDINHWSDGKSCSHYCHCANDDCFYARCPIGQLYYNGQCRLGMGCRSVDEADNVFTIPDWHSDIIDTDILADGTDVHINWPTGQDFACHTNVCADGEKPPCRFECKADAGFWRDIASCNRYCLCSGMDAPKSSWYYECTAPLVYDAESQVCVFKDITKPCEVFTGEIPQIGDVAIPDLELYPGHDHQFEYKCDNPCPSPPCTFECKYKGNFPSVSDCSRYCECHGEGQASWYKQCGKDLFWNLGVCDYYENIDHSVCDPKGEQNPNQISQETHGTEYETEIDDACGRTCIIRNGQGECSYICKKPIGYYRSSRDCSRYCYCSGDNFFATSGYFQCPPGTMFDPNQHLCTYISRAMKSPEQTPDCTYIEKPLDPPAHTGNTDPATLSPLEMCDSPCKLAPHRGECKFSCQIDSGFYQDRTDCTRFCRCTGKAERTSYYFQCPKGTVFNEVTTTCDYPWHTDTSQCEGELPNTIDEMLKGMIHGDETIRPVHQQEKCAIYPKGIFKKKWRITMDICDSTNRKQFHRWHFDLGTGHIISKDLVIPEKKIRRCLTWNARFSNLAYHTGRTREAIYIHTCNEAKFHDTQKWQLRPDGLLQPKGKNDYCVYTAQDQRIGIFDKYLYIGKCPNMHYAHPIDELKYCKMRACDRRPCGDGAYCLQDPLKIDEYSCQCPRGQVWRGPGYFGKDTQGRCEYITCSTSPCTNGGICYSRVGDNGSHNYGNGWSPDAKRSYDDRYICICPVGYKGRNCEESVVCTSDDNWANESKPDECNNLPAYTDAERKRDNPVLDDTSDDTPGDDSTPPSKYGGGEEYPGYATQTRHPFKFQDPSLYEINHIASSVTRKIPSETEVNEWYDMDAPVDPPLRAMSATLHPSEPSFVEFEIDTSELDKRALDEDHVPMLFNEIFVNGDVTLGIGPATMGFLDGTIWMPTLEHYKGWVSSSDHTGLKRDESTDDLLYDGFTPRSFSVRYVNGFREWRHGNQDNALCLNKALPETCWEATRLISNPVKRVALIWIPTTKTLYIRENRGKINGQTEWNDYIQAANTNEDGSNVKVVLDEEPPFGVAFYFVMNSPYTKLRVLSHGKVDVGQRDALSIQNNLRKFKIQDAVLQENKISLKYESIEDVLKPVDVYQRSPYEDIYSKYNYAGPGDLARCSYAQELDETKKHYVRYEVRGREQYVGKHPYSMAFGIGPTGFEYPENQLDMIKMEAYEGWTNPITYTGFDGSPQMYDGTSARSFTIAYEPKRRTYYHGNQVPAFYAEKCGCKLMDDGDHDLVCETSEDFWTCMGQYTVLHEPIDTISMIYDPTHDDHQLYVYENGKLLDKYVLDTRQKWTWFFLIKDVDIKVRIVEVGEITNTMITDWNNRGQPFGYEQLPVPGHASDRLECDPDCSMCCDITRGVCPGKVPNSKFWTRPKSSEMRPLEDYLTASTMPYTNREVACVVQPENSGIDYITEELTKEPTTDLWAETVHTVSHQVTPQDGPRWDSGMCNFHGWKRDSYTSSRTSVTWTDPQSSANSLCGTACDEYHPLPWYWDATDPATDVKKSKSVKNLFFRNSDQMSYKMGSRFVSVQELATCKHMVHTDCGTAAGTHVFRADRSYHFRLKRVAYYNLQDGAPSCEGVIIGVKELKYTESIPERFTYDVTRNYFYNKDGEKVLRDFIQFAPYRGEITTSPASLQQPSDGCRRFNGVDPRCASNCGDIEMKVDMTSDIHQVKFKHMGEWITVNNDFVGAHKSLWGFHMFVVTNGQEFVVEQLHPKITVATVPANAMTVVNGNKEPYAWCNTICGSCCDLNRGTCGDNNRVWNPYRLAADDTTHRACACWQGMRPPRDDCMNEKACHSDIYPLAWENSDELTRKAIDTVLHLDSKYRYIQEFTGCKVRINTATNAPAVTQKLEKDHTYHYVFTRTAWLKPDRDLPNEKPVAECGIFEIGFTTDNLWEKELSQSDRDTAKTVPLVRCSTDTAQNIKCTNRVCDYLEIIAHVPDSTLISSKGVLLYRTKPKAAWTREEPVLHGKRLFMITGGMEMLGRRLPVGTDLRVKDSTESGYEQVTMGIDENGVSQETRVDLDTDGYFNRFQESDKSTMGYSLAVETKRSLFTGTFYRTRKPIIRPTK